MPTLCRRTCLALGSQFGILIDQFWDVKGYRDGQFKSEVERFGIFLRQRVTTGAIVSPFVGELLDFELARNELEFTPRKQILRAIAHLGPPKADTPCRLHPLARLVRFRHDPRVLLRAAANGIMPPPDLPETEVLVVLSVINGALRVTQFAGAMLVSPLRTDSRQLVSKIYWWQSAKNGIIREPEWREPTGFVWFAPAGSGNVWVDVYRRIIQNYPHSRGYCVSKFASLVPAWGRLRSDYPASALVGWPAPRFAPALADAGLLIPFTATDEAPFAKVNVVQA
jgi:hypothetical protein